MRFPSFVDRRRLLDLAVDVATMAVLFGAGATVRLGHLVDLPLHFDNVDPFLRAYAWVHDWSTVVDGRSDAGPLDLLFPASAPWLGQFGPGLVWSYVPLVVGAPTLESAFVRRYLVQALLAPLVFLALRRGIPWSGGAASNRGVNPASYLAGIVGALAIGFCGEPFGTVAQGDQTYLAPEFAMATAAAVLFATRGRGAPWVLLAMAAVPWAAMVHPMAIALAPGLLWVVALLWNRARTSIVVVGVVLAACVSLPECFHLASVWRQGGEGSAFAATIGYTGSLSLSPAEVFRQSSRAWWGLQPTGIGPLLLAGPWVVLAFSVPPLWRRSFREAIPDSVALSSCVFALYTLTTAAALLGIGVLVGYLQPYQWRVVLPAHALTLGLAIYLVAHSLPFLRGAPSSRVHGALSLAVLVICAALLVAIVNPRTDGASPKSALFDIHRGMARVIAEDAGESPRWFDAIVLDHDAQPFCWAFTPAVFLEQRMGGAPREAFRHTGRLYLVLSGPRQSVAAIVHDMGWDADGTPLVGQSLDGVHLVGRHPVNSAAEILVVRLDDSASSRAWTGWLFSRTPSLDPRLLLDSNHVLHLTEDGYDMADGWAWFDDAMLKQHMQTADAPTRD